MRGKLKENSNIRLKMKNKKLEFPKNKVKILNVGISSMSMDEVLMAVASRLKKGKTLFITTPNPEILVASQIDEGLREAVSSSDISVPDGVGIVWALKLLKGVALQRVRGRELFIRLLEIANERSLKVFLLGSTKSVIEASIKTVHKKFPEVDISGDKYVVLGQNAEFVSKEDSLKHKEIVSDINKFKPDMLFVAFGAPKQEKWIAKHLSELDVNVAMTIGGTLDYFSGKASLPPKLLADLGLEWAWRLIKEPWRARRIINAVIIFPILVLKEKLKG